MWEKVNDYLSNEGLTEVKGCQCPCYNFSHHILKLIRCRGPVFSKLLFSFSFSFVAIHILFGAIEVYKLSNGRGKC